MGGRKKKKEQENLWILLNVLVGLWSEIPLLPWWKHLEQEGRKEAEEGVPRRI